MKKEFLLNKGFMVALLAVAVGFAACSSDDDNDDNSKGGAAPVVNGKKLAFIKNGSSTTIYEYDSDGRIISATGSGYKRIYNYSENQITCTSSYGSGSSADITTYMLTDGRITKKIEKASSSYSGSYNSSGNDRITNYTYDGGQLISVECTYVSSYSYSSSSSSTTQRYKTTYIWRDGNVYQMTYEYNYNSESRSTSDSYYSSNNSTYSSQSKTVTTYTYSDKSAQVPIIYVDDEVLYFQGYFGKKISNLASKEQSIETYSSTGGSVSTTTSSREYVYSFNSDMLEKILITSTSDNGGTSIETVEVSWN